MSTLFFFLAAAILSTAIRWLLTEHVRKVQAGLWGCAMIGLMAPLYLNFGAEPVVRELVWPFAAGLIAGEQFAAWLRRPPRPKTPDKPGAAHIKTSKRKKLKQRSDI